MALVDWSERISAQTASDPVNLLREQNKFQAGATNALRHSVSYGQNMAGAMMTVALAHGVPTLVANPLQGKALPLGTQVFGCDSGLLKPEVTASPTATVSGATVTAPAGFIYLTALYPAINITDWVSYVPSFGSWSANVSSTGQWRKVGDTLEAQAHLDFTGAPSGSLSTIGLPSGLLIDTTKILNSSLARNTFGHGVALANGTGVYQCNIGYASSTAVRPTSYGLGGTTVNSPILDEQINATTPNTWKSGDTLDLYFRVPIVGWSITPTATANVTLFVVGG